MSHGLERLDATGHYSKEEVATLVESLGGNLARELAGARYSLSEMSALGFETARGLGPVRGAEFLFGLRRSLGDVPLEGDPGHMVEELCREAAAGTYPLCPVAGERLVASGLTAWPSGPEGLFLPGVPPFDSLDRGVRDALLAGAAVRLGSVSPRLSLAEQSLDAWDVDDARLFRLKWTVRGGRRSTVP